MADVPSGPSLDSTPTMQIKKKNFKVATGRLVGPSLHLLHFYISPHFNKFVLTFYVHYLADFSMKPSDDCVQSKHVIIEKRAACVFVAAGTFLPSRCLANVVSSGSGSGSTISAFRRHVTLHSRVVKGETQTHTSR
jgi:hypothetical protein